MGLLGALVTREAFGRYIVQMSGTASRISFERLNEAWNACPNLQQLIHRIAPLAAVRAIRIASIR
ncbi:hypothetical protein JKG68_22085 [Microvirga aerilata]|uniref:Uncharacterized protein n=1 Tax=Microvirga aerilata TaxID=670292 RepID=A0A937CY95_9HYPH|nr:hypothetical protein [Microvirga aerilata]MBL0406648.1 hypothetical protein [Microvirga aerilata]